MGVGVAGLGMVVFAGERVFEAFRVGAAAGFGAQLESIRLAATNITKGAVSAFIIVFMFSPAKG
jgi:hypothetical protein